MKAKILFLLSLLVTMPAGAQVVADIAVRAGPANRVDVPVSALVPGAPEAVALFEVTDGLQMPVASSFDGDRLSWIVRGETVAGSVRVFELRAGLASEGSDMAVYDDGESVHLLAAGRPVLAYRHAVQPVPEASTPLNARSGFIHPLRSPSGQVLTRIQPPDHWHHYGIWNPWTHTRFRGRHVDFWNLFSGQGLVRHVRLAQLAASPVHAGFQAALDHVVTDSSSGETVALQEAWEVKVWDTHRLMVDFMSTLTPAGSEPLTIEAYRYQGFGFRGREDWGDDTSTILTSEGFDKGTGNTTRARWLIVEGVSGAAEGRSGVLFLSHPANHNHPEHVRIWPTGMNGGQENIFINFNPAQEADWSLMPGSRSTLRYRMVPFDGAMGTEEAERYWQDYAHPPTVEVRPSHLTGARVLVFTRNGEGYVHENIPYSVAALRTLGLENGFDVVASESPAIFHADSLSAFDVIVFSNTNNDIFDTPGQEAALQSFVRRGGGVMGIHSASGSERDWPWFSRLLGGNFERHAPLQDFEVEVLDHAHPATAFLGRRWAIQGDECYFLRELSPNIHTVLAADLTTVDDPGQPSIPGNRFGDRYPIAWSQTFDGGRQFYTSLGHRPEHYSAPQFLRHILGGLRWVAGSGSH